MKALLPVLVLALTAAILGSLLAITAHFTTPLIERNRTLAESVELQRLWDILENRSSALDLSAADLESCKYRPVVASTSVRGYGGDIELATAFLGESIVAVRAISHQETPGFADVLQPDDWIALFSVNQFDEIDTVSRATITTNAVLKGVRQLTTDHLDAFGSCNVEAN